MAIPLRYIATGEDYVNMNYIDEYRKCAELCRHTDYGSKQSVCEHNEAVKRMYKIVEQATQAGNEAITALVSLLDDEISSKWIAHHLIEKTKIDPSIRIKCLKIIEKLANGDGPDAFGEQVWLEEWKNK
jgi:hypothetical protein